MDTGHLCNHNLNLMQTNRAEIIHTGHELRPLQLYVRSYTIKTLTVAPNLMHDYMYPVLNN